MDYENIRKQLDVLPIKELIPQEEHIPKNLQRLKEVMLSIGMLVDPIIIDKKHKIVLDGNHRLKVLELIKVPCAVCQVVDYDRKDIEVGSWFPADVKIKKELFEKAGVMLEEVEFEQGKKDIQDGKAAFMLVDKEKKYLVEPGKYTLDSMVDEQQEILGKIKGENFWYYSDDTVQEYLDKGKGALFRKIYTKEEIVKRALTGKPFPPKSNRHLIPDRIIRLNVGLGRLHQGAEECSEHLDKMLKKRIYDGSVRRYLEPVIVIY